MSGDDSPTESYQRPGSQGPGDQNPTESYQRPGYQDPSQGPTGGYPTPGYQAPARPVKRRHRLRNTIIALVVLLVVLVAVDRLAAFYVQGRIASQIQDQGFPAKPTVSIKGFPFLTQVISRHFQEVQISSQNVKTGPVEIKSINATMSDVRMNSGYSAGTVGSLSGTGVITFGSMKNAIGNLAGGQLAQAIGGSGLTLKPVSSDEVKASISLLGLFNASATWQIIRVNGHEIKVHLVSNNGLPGSIINQARNINVPIPKLPLGMKIQSVVVTSAGITIRVTGHDVAFGG
jgi:LmeA-like phospholipid-binding